MTEGALRLCDVPYADISDLPRDMHYCVDDTVILSVTYDWGRSRTTRWRVVKAGTYWTAEVEPLVGFY